MHKYGINKPNTNSQTLPYGVPPMEGNQKKLQYPVRHKNATALANKLMRYLNDIGIFEEI